MRFASLFRTKRFVISFHKMIDVPTISYFARKRFNGVAISREFRFRKRTSSVRNIVLSDCVFFTNYTYPRFQWFQSQYIVHFIVPISASSNLQYLLFVFQTRVYTSNPFRSQCEFLLCTCCESTAVQLWWFEHFFVFPDWKLKHQCLPFVIYSATSSWIFFLLRIC